MTTKTTSATRARATRTPRAVSTAIKNAKRLALQDAQRALNQTRAGLALLGAAPQTELVARAAFAAHAAAKKAHLKMMTAKAAAEGTSVDYEVENAEFTLYEPFITTSASYYPLAGASISIRELDGMRDERLLAVLEVLEDLLTPAGFVAQSTDYAHSEHANRDFEYQLEVPTELEGRAEKLRYSVRVYAYVRSDSPTCRVIVRGTREVVTTEEIREIVCE